jgi:single-strand DNA-binding protein
MHGDIHAAFIATVGSEPALQTSAAGKKWAAFSGAVGKDDDTQWVRISMFGGTAERLAGQLPKGSKVYAEGTLKLSRWTDKTSGEERTGLQLAAWKVEPLFRVGRSKLKTQRSREEGSDEHQGSAMEA